MHKKRIIASLTILSVTACKLLSQDMPPANKAAFLKQMQKIDAVIEAGPYKADMKDLERHEAAPEWVLDGKLGIYFHWGIYTVTGVHEWYIQKMYTIDRYKQGHEKQFGPIEQWPYHRLVDLFTTKKFDAKNWAQLFKDAGAKFAGPVAIHHDTFAMWNSDITPWNSVNYGPKRDIVGELADSIKGQGLKLITTFHHERSQWFIPRIKGNETTSLDPEMRIRYANYTVEEYSKIFLAETAEVIDKYKPDAIWFDGKLKLIEPQLIHEKLLAYYFNSAAKTGQNVMVNTKFSFYPASISVLDFERGGAGRLTKDPWLSDDSVSKGWMYRKPFSVRPKDQILHNFVNIVSQNGILFLNICPTTDGEITDNQRDILHDLGAWLKVNGEGIYATRPWLAFGEGPNKGGTTPDGKNIQVLTKNDIRYTRSKDNSTLYAFVMAWPEKVTLKSVKVTNPNGKVELFGYGPLDYTVNSDGQLTIQFPDLPVEKRPCKYAYGLKLSGFGHTLHPSSDRSWQMFDTPKEQKAVKEDL